MNEIGYRELLKKYMSFVFEAADYHFIHGDDRSRCGRHVQFSDAEWAALVRVKDELVGDAVHRIASWLSEKGEPIQ